MQLSIKYDFERQDSTVMDGVITRSGKFKYDDGIRIKDWNNLVEVFENTDHLRVIGTTKQNSHLDIDDRIIGFAHNFVPDHENELMYADIEFFENIEDLSDLEDPKDLPVSIGFGDLLPPGSGTSKITGVSHLAVSLNANEKDRCSSMNGHSCTISKKKTESDKGRSSSSIGDLVKLKKKRDDSIMPKGKEEEEITEERQDAIESQQNVITKKPAAPDNVGSATHDKKLIDESAKKSFMTDCKKYGAVPDSNCEAAWKALNGNTSAPVKDKKKATKSPTKLPGNTTNKDFDDLKEDMNDMKAVISQLADFLPVLSDVVKDKQNNEAVKTVEMREELKEAGFCADMLDKMTDYADMDRFYKMAKTNKDLFPDPDPNAIQNINTTRLLGKRKDMEKEREDLMNKAKVDALNRLKKPSLREGA